VIMSTQQLKYLMALLFIVLLTMASFAYFIILPSEIPLFYSLGRIQDQLAKKEFIFLLPGLSLIFWLVALLFGKTIKDDVVIKLVDLVSFFLIAVLYIILIRTIYLVT